jgi:hypothetical protein
VLAKNLYCLFPELRMGGLVVSIGASCALGAPSAVLPLQPTSGFDYSADAYVEALQQFVAAVGIKRPFALVVQGALSRLLGLPVRPACPPVALPRAAPAALLCCLPHLAR